MKVVYTDGACIPNPGNGGWAWALIDSDQLVDQASGKMSETTSNRMEYFAMIQAIEKHGPIIKVIFTDSQLLQKTSMEWRHQWKKNNYKKGTVKNLDLVLRISELLDKHPQIKVEWVKGHNGNEWNEFVDELANIQAEE